MKPSSSLHCLAYFALFILRMSKAQMSTDMPTEMTTGTECRTTEGVLCVFPFKANGRLHHECTWEDAFRKSSPWAGAGGNGRAWCGTTEKGDDFVEGQRQFGHWGDCGRGCTITGVELRLLEAHHLTVQLLRTKYSSILFYG